MTNTEPPPQNTDTVPALEAWHHALIRHLGLPFRITKIGSYPYLLYLLSLMAVAFLLVKYFVHYSTNWIAQWDNSADLSFSLQVPADIIIAVLAGIIFWATLALAFCLPLRLIQIRGRLTTLELLTLSPGMWLKAFRTIFLALRLGVLNFLPALVLLGVYLYWEPSHPQPALKPLMTVAVWALGLATLANCLSLLISPFTAVCASYDARSAIISSRQICKLNRLTPTALLLMLVAFFILTLRQFQSVSTSFGFFELEFSEWIFLADSLEISALLFGLWYFITQLGAFIIRSLVALEGR